MCTFCLDRVAASKKPICVEACPMRALDAGPLDELKEKYGARQEAEGFIYSKKTRPSIIFKPRYQIT
jgi:anaerobic dimethyl sulfoxide reductase subunit B (iron-sulfur subunit)